MAATLQGFLDRTRRFISPRTGLILHVADRCNEHGDALIHMARAEVGVTSRYGLPVDCPNQNGGAGLTRDSARAAAIGEAIERYACGVYDPADFLTSDYRSLPGRGVPPERLRLYSAAQYASPGFPFPPITETTRLRWRAATSMVNGEPVWYPAGLTHVPYVWDEAETPFCPSLTTGMALGDTPLEAALTGLYEAIERDAFMITWWNRLPAPEVVVEQDSPLGRLVARHFTVPGLTFRLFDITTDVGVPVILCVLLEQIDSGCSLTVGAACRADPAGAALKAMMEAAKGRNTQRLVARQSGPLDLHGPPDLHGPLDLHGRWELLQNLDDHARLYARLEMRPALDFLLKHDRKVALSSLPNLDAGSAAETLRRCVAAVAATDLEPLAMDLTPPDLTQAGLAAVKVAVPGMVELNPWHSLRCLGCQRLYEVPVRMGYRRQPATEAELNPFPHPFP